MKTMLKQSKLAEYLESWTIPYLDYMVILAQAMDHAKETRNLTSWEPKDIPSRQMLKELLGILERSCLVAFETVSEKLVEISTKPKVVHKKKKKSAKPRNMDKMEVDGDEEEDVEEEDESQEADLDQEMKDGDGDYKMANASGSDHDTGEHQSDSNVMSIGIFEEGGTLEMARAANRLCPSDTPNLLQNNTYVDAFTMDALPIIPPEASPQDLSHLLSGTLESPHYQRILSTIISSDEDVHDDHQVPAEHVIFSAELQHAMDVLTTDRVSKDLLHDAIRRYNSEEQSRVREEKSLGEIITDLNT